MQASFQKIKNLNFDMPKAYPLEIESNLEVAQAVSGGSKKSAYRKFMAENNQQSPVFCQESLTDQFKAGTLQRKVGNKLIDPNTLIHQAILENNPEVIRFLLNHGVDVDYPDENGMSPLTVAILNRSNYAVTVLLEHSANVNPKVKWNNMNLLELAFTMNDWESVKKLINCKGIDFRRSDGTSLLPHAINVFGSNKDLMEIPKTMINNGCEITSAAAYYAVVCASPRSGDLSILKLLIEKGYDLNKDCDHGFSAPIIHAIDNWNEDVIKFLLNAGSDINKLGMRGNNDQITALMIAISSGNLENVKFLVEHGADVNQKVLFYRRGEKVSPIKYALERGLPEIVQYLLQHGARA
jgi:ankyrin repeat protein